MEMLPRIFWPSGIMIIGLYKFKVQQTWGGRLGSAATDILTEWMGNIFATNYYRWYCKDNDIERYVSNYQAYDNLPAGPDFNLLRPWAMWSLSGPTNSKVEIYIIVTKANIEK